MKDFNPLEKRVFKYKNPALEFFCPLCRTKRGFLYSPKMKLKNWMYVIYATIFLVMALYPFWELKSFFVFFVVWGVVEFSVRQLFKREIPCPHCGFDASWYRRDVTIARKKVEEFWKNKGLFPTKVK